MLSRSFVQKSFACSWWQRRTWKNATQKILQQHFRKPFKRCCFCINEEINEILKNIKENDGRIQKKVLAEIAEDRKILNINAREENHSQARFASLDKKLIQPLMRTWNFVEEEKIGKNRWISFTDDGKNASEFLF